MVQHCSKGDIIQNNTSSQCACITRTNVLGLENGYTIMCFDGPSATYGDVAASIGKAFTSDWSMASSNVTGTVGITAVTDQLLGTGTNFTGELSPGDKLILGDYQVIIDTVDDNTTITLTASYTGATLSGADLWKL